MTAVKDALFHAEMVLEEMCAREDIPDVCEADELCGEEWCAAVGCLALKRQTVRAAMAELGVSPWEDYAGER